MARVGPPLVTDHDIVLLGEQIDDLPFGLIAPLQSDNTTLPAPRKKDPRFLRFFQDCQTRQPTRPQGGGQVGGRRLSAAGHHHRVHRLVFDGQLRGGKPGALQVLGILRQGKCATAIGIDQHIDGEQGPFDGKHMVRLHHHIANPDAAAVATSKSL